MPRIIKCVLLVALVLVLVFASTASGWASMDNLITTGTTPVSSNVFTGSVQRDYVIPKLDPILSQIYQAYQAGDWTKLATFAGYRHIDVEAQTALVILEMGISPQAHPVGEPYVEFITMEDGSIVRLERAPQIAINSDIQNAILATGATYETAFQNWVQVLAPFGSLQGLSQIMTVNYVRLPFPVETHDLPDSNPQVGTQTTQGVDLTQADEWFTRGSNGSGVNLAVYDFGFTNWDLRQASGDLPGGAQLVLHDFSGAFNFGPPSTAGYDHGTSCAEIAYDMAPGSTVHLYAWGTEAEFGNAVTNYQGVSGKKVASMSIGFVNAGPYDGTGSINTIIDNAQTNGIFWANSAGNSQKEHYSWTSTQFETGNYVAFGDGNLEGIGPSVGYLWNIPTGTVLQIFLEWNDWNAGRTGNQNHIDYGLFLLRLVGGNWNQVASSDANQCNLTNAPTEAIAYTVPNGGPYNYAIVITRFDAVRCPNNFGHWMQLYTFNGFYVPGTGADYAFWYANTCNSLTIPADGDSAVTVGAAYWGEDNLPPLFGLETFSSLGPRNASGGSNPGTTVNEPDVVAPDGVNTVTDGTNNGTNFANGGGGFWGTSAAAPHVGGFAATAWSGHPTDSLAQLRAFIQSEALYKADGGTCGGALGGSGGQPMSGTQNNRYGWGRIFFSVTPTSIELVNFTARSINQRLPLVLAAVLVPAAGLLWLVIRRRAVR
jgi:Subtilase family